MYPGDFMCRNVATNDAKLESTKYHFNIFVLITQHYSCHKVLRTQWLKYKWIGDIQNMFVYFGGFICWNEATNDTKLE
jgi:hypothetical protein